MADGRRAHGGAADEAGLRLSALRSVGVSALAVAVVAVLLLGAWLPASNSAQRRSALMRTARVAQRPCFKRWCSRAARWRRRAGRPSGWT
jgi:hypothetical protein